MKLPDLTKEKIITVDVETKDVNLNTHGPGGVRKDGHIVGVAIGADGFSTYLPLRHEGGDNLDLRRVKPWLKKTLASKVPKLGANILYDMEFCKAEGIPINGPKYDVQVAEALLDEDRTSYNLDSLSRDYLGEQKKTDSLKDGLERIGIKKYKDPRALIYKLPGSFVSKYAIGDVELPLQIWRLQEKKLRDENLFDCFLKESELLDVLLDMRFTGVRVDIDRAEKVAKRLKREQKTMLKRLRTIAGFPLDIWSNQSITKMCKSLGINYPLTAKHNPSFTGQWLEQQDIEALSLIVRARKIDRIGSVYVQDKIINMAVNGYVYPSFHSTKNDRYGTGSGRVSSSNPNFQQIPSKDPYLAPLVRSIIIAEPGCLFGKFDYSQQEPRVTVHYAYRLKLKGAIEAYQKYLSDPRTDYHQMTADMAEIERKPAKTINLGLTYGMGKKTLGRSLGLNQHEAEALFNKYHAAVPFIRELSRYVQRIAKRRGYIVMLDGRRKRFQFWGPVEYTKDYRPMRYQEALDHYGPPIQRYFMHKSLNNLIQGTSAGMTKQALIDCWKAGYRACLTVHDENDYANLENEKQAREIKAIHEDAVKLDVPLICDAEIGKSWGDLEPIKE